MELESRTVMATTDGSSSGGKQKVGHTLLDANNEPQKFKKLELENLQRSIQHGIVMIISNEQLYQPERQLLMIDLDQVIIIKVQGSEVPKDKSSSASSRLSSSLVTTTAEGTLTEEESNRDSSYYHNIQYNDLNSRTSTAADFSAVNNTNTCSSYSSSSNTNLNISNNLSPQTETPQSSSSASYTTTSSKQPAIADFRFKAYAPRAFDFFRKKYNVELPDFMKSITEPMKCIPNTGASGSLFFITADDCFIMKTLQKKEATFLLELYPGYILNLYQCPDTLLPKYFGCYCYQSALGKNVRVAIMNNLIPRNVTLWKKYDLKGSTYKRVTDVSKTSSKVPTLKDLNFKEDFKDSRILLDSDIYNALISRINNDSLMLESFRIMDYSFLMAIEEVDVEKERVATLRPDQDNVPSFYQYSTILNLPSLRHQKGIPAIREYDGKHLRLYVGIIDILQRYVMKKKMEYRIKATFLETQGNEVSVTHPKKFQRRFLSFLQNEVFKENKTKQMTSYLDHPLSRAPMMSRNGRGDSRNNGNSNLPSYNVPTVLTSTQGSPTERFDSSSPRRSIGKTHFEGTNPSPIGYNDALPTGRSTVDRSAPLPQSRPPQPKFDSSSSHGATSRTNPITPETTQTRISSVKSSRQSYPRTASTNGPTLAKQESLSELEDGHGQMLLSDGDRNYSSRMYSISENANSFAASDSSNCIASGYTVNSKADNSKENDSVTRVTTTSTTTDLQSRQISPYKTNTNNANPLSSSTTAANKIRQETSTNKSISDSNNVSGAAVV